MVTRTTTTLTAVILAGLFLVGCDDLTREPTTTLPPDSTTTVPEGVRPDEGPPPPVEGPTETEREQYLRAVNEELAEIDRSIARMREKGQELRGEAREMWQNTLDDLQEKRQAYQQELEQLQAAGGNAWRDFKDATQAAWEELKQAARDASNQLNGDESAAGEGLDAGAGQEDVPSQTPPPVPATPENEAGNR